MLTTIVLFAQLTSTQLTFTSNSNPLTPGQAAATVMKASPDLNRTHTFQLEALPDNWLPSTTSGSSWKPGQATSQPSNLDLQEYSRYRVSSIAPKEEEIMIAAIYARKSTDQSVVDEAKSVVRQVDHAKKYAAKKGWAVDERFIFVDDGISGAEFERRPGFIRLMASLGSKRTPFQVLIMSEESRLGREMTQTMSALGAIVRAGVRVFYYMEDREATLNSPIEKAMMMMGSFGAELEREKARQRAEDTSFAKARAGLVTGGRTYGYENVGDKGSADSQDQR